MRSAAIALAALTASLLLPSSTVLAQGLPQPGERVRVTSGVYQRLVSTVQAVSAESLSVRANGTEIHLAMAQVSLLEKSVGQKSYAYNGMVLGWVVGGFVGFAIANAAVDDECRETRIRTFDCFGEDLKPLVGAGIGFVVLGVAGWLIGGSIKSDRWQAVPLDNVGVSIVPRGDGRFTLGMSVSF